MFLVVDIGNTHTDVAMATPERVAKSIKLKTTEWTKPQWLSKVTGLVKRRSIDRIAIASVVPQVGKELADKLERTFGAPCITLTNKTVVGIGIDYPKPGTIGPDRLANAMAATAFYGAPVVVVDFGTAVTFDVVDPHKNYIGGIIAPGLSAMTDYLHEKTALLPRVKIQAVDRAVGKSTREAMLIGAVKGYRGLITSLLTELKQELGVRKLKVVATGGYAELMAKDLKQVFAINQQLTLEGLRLLALNCSRLPLKSSKASE
jgi:type III pantothenate kinase